MYPALTSSIQRESWAKSAAARCASGLSSAAVTVSSEIRASRWAVSSSKNSCAAASRACSAAARAASCRRPRPPDPDATLDSARTSPLPPLILPPGPPASAGGSARIRVATGTFRGTYRGRGSGAGGGDDRVGGEAHHQAGEDAPGGQGLQAGAAGDREQLDHDVEDRAGRQAQEGDGERVVHQ